MFAVILLMFVVIGLVANVLFTIKYKKLPETSSYGHDRESRVFLGGLRIASFILYTLSALFFVLESWTIIPAGHVGVKVVFGSVQEETIPEGLHVVNPFASITPMSIRTQEVKEAMQAPSSEGLLIYLEVSALFRLNPESANTVYQTVGDNYVDVILIPQFRSIVRAVTSSYRADALYSGPAREKLAEEIAAGVQSAIKSRGLTVETTPLRDVKLPEQLTRAIETKMQADQEQQRMEFVLQREAKEAERKAVEAKGIANFQKIVTQGISEPLLRWKGIEATEKLAESNNTKIVVIGGKDGLPLILNQ